MLCESGTWPAGEPLAGSVLPNPAGGRRSRSEPPGSNPSPEPSAQPPLPTHSYDTTGRAGSLTGAEPERRYPQKVWKCRRRCSLPLKSKNPGWQARERGRNTAMVEKITDTRSASRAAWESLESWAREKVQDFVQALLEEEVTELLGRAKSVRRATVDAAAGSRNGHGMPRLLLSDPAGLNLRPRGTGQVERRDLRIDLRRLCGRLDRRQRQLLALRFGRGMCLAEVAGALRISVSTVLREERRAVRQLRMLADQRRGPSAPRGR
jgi:RNA polymerase sigma factor (sigma-70 family)